MLQESVGLIKQFYLVDGILEYRVYHGMMALYHLLVGCFPSIITLAGHSSRAQKLVGDAAQSGDDNDYGLPLSFFFNNLFYT